VGEMKTPPASFVSSFAHGLLALGFELEQEIVSVSIDVLLLDEEDIVYSCCPSRCKKERERIGVRGGAAL
jgi:hypothetical protein